MDWIVKIGDAEYPAQNEDMILEWIRLNRITPESTIFSPHNKAWLTVLQFAEALGPAVMLSTTPSLEGFRILQYLGVEAGESDALALVFMSTAEQMLSMRQTALFVLQQRAILRGGNAVVGVELDFFHFREAHLCAHAYGTVVVAEKLPQS